MCGIAGIWNRLDEAAMAEMARSVAHRGPDGLDWLTIGNSSLGASRLAITGDPTASAIYTEPESKVAVLFNGEIYNVTNLRAELAASGAVFHTDLESEVVAKLYDRYGLDFARHLQGMFAIVVAHDTRLVLARDRFGIKPLYYACVGEKVLFGSEVKALLAHPEVTGRLHIPALEEAVVFGYVYSTDKTLFEGIVQVEPGTIVHFSDRKRSVVKYWNAPEASYFDPERHLDYPTAVTKLRESIIGTMDSLLSHGDHPMGVYLSGGLDSTILALVAQVILDCPVTTFTLADDLETADLLAAREVARRLGTHHVERRVTIDDYFDRLRHYIRHYESFVSGGVFDVHGGMAFHLLSETVAEHVKVAFSGEGADELFGGYYWTYTHPLGFADRIRSRLMPDPICTEVRRVVNDLFPVPEDERIYQRNVFDALMGGGLANYHLQSVDRSAGAFGFEVRPAYLSDELASLALSLPIEYKVDGKQVTKRILREAFRPELEQLGLDWVAVRPKEAMPTAVAGLAPCIAQRMEASIDDTSISRHPLKRYLRSKADVYLFDLFAETFLPGESCAIQHRLSQ